MDTYWNHTQLCWSSWWCH